MNQQDISLLLAVLGSTIVTTAWWGRRCGDSARDAWLMFAVGACMFAGSLGVPLLL
jgi:hypothetical protein